MWQTCYGCNNYNIISYYTSIYIYLYICLLCLLAMQGETFKASSVFLSCITHKLVTYPNFYDLRNDVASRNQRVRPEPGEKM